MLTLYHAPNSRSGTVLWLLEELGVPYRLEFVDIRGEGGAPEDYRAIHPNKKVPALVHDGVTIIERAAICAYLGDEFPQAGLAPPIGDPRRGPYLAWLAYNDAVIDPVIGARFLGWQYDKRAASFGGFDDMVTYLEKTLSQTPFLTGDAFTAADLLVASDVNIAVRFTKLLPDSPPFVGFLARTVGRPAFARANAKGRAP